MPRLGTTARGAARSGAGRPDGAAAPRVARVAARRATTTSGFDDDDAAEAAAVAQRASTRSRAGAQPAQPSAPRTGSPSQLSPNSRLKLLKHASTQRNFAFRQMR
eukprot:2206919-Pleurochrysis_carterae.AAC.2